MNPNDVSPPIPDLRIVAVADVLPHEEHDPQRSEPLVKRIAAADSWLNPPIVAPIVDDLPEITQQRYVVLDGANRHYCLKALGIPYILVQVVDYAGEQVRLEAWNHVLSDVEVRDLMPHIHEIDGLHLQSSNRAQAEAWIEAGAAVGYIRILPDEIHALCTTQTDFYTRNRILRALVNIYKNVAKIDRVNGDNPVVIRKLFPDAAAVVIFPQYTAAEIVMAARDNIHIPPGISRHIVNGRAMRLHYPLEALRDTQTPLEQKNADLLRWIQERVAKKNVRLYAEATYIFDE